MAAMDDLDDLLNDLERSKGSTAGGPPPSNASNSKRINSNALELDELNDLMNDLGAASAKPAAKPAAPNASSSQRGTTVRRDIVSGDMNKSMEDLDALMSSLNTADARASTAPAVPKAAPPPASRASVQSEDLDALMASLENPRGSVAPKAAAKPAPGPSRPVSGVPSANDDLDALMADLDNPRKSTAVTSKPAPAQPASRPVSKVPGGDDLDALMADLDSSGSRRSAAPTQAPVVAAKPAPKPMAKAAPPPADDLDSLMADLDGPRKSTQPPAYAAAPKAAAPASRPVSGVTGGDDLDALMADLEGGGRSRPVSGVPVAKPAPVAAAPKAAPVVAAAPKKAAPVQQSSDMDDLDALMGSLNSDRRSVAPAKPAAKPAAPSEDLDSLMGSLGQPSQKAPVTYAPTVTHQPPPKPAAKKPAGAAPAAGGDDISKLMNSLASQVADAGDGSSVSKGMCAYCKKQILGEVVSAIGKVFHVDHWICQNCQDPLGTKVGNALFSNFPFHIFEFRSHIPAQTFFELDGAPYCEKCYSSTYCVKCGYCDEPILDRCITAIGAHADSTPSFYQIADRSVSSYRQEVAHQSLHLHPVPAAVPARRVLRARRQALLRDGLFRSLLPQVRRLRQAHPRRLRQRARPAVASGALGMHVLQEGVRLGAVLRDRRQALLRAALPPAVGRAVPGLQEAHPGALHHGAGQEVAPGALHLRLLHEPPGGRLVRGEAGQAVLQDLHAEALLLSERRLVYNPTPRLPATLVMCAACRDTAFSKNVSQVDAPRSQRTGRHLAMFELSVLGTRLTRHALTHHTER